VVGAFLIGGAVLLLMVGCSGVRSETPKKEQGRTEAANGQAHSERCERTRKMHLEIFEPPGTDKKAPFITNDVPGCPKCGLLSGTKKTDYFAGKDGEDEIRGLGGADYIEGGLGGDFVYGGPGNDYLWAKFGWSEEPPPEPPKDLSNNVLHGGSGSDRMFGANGDDVLYGGEGDDGLVGNDDESGGSGKDVLYGGPGNDTLYPAKDGQRDELYCGKGKDRFLNVADEIDYIDTSCEIKERPYVPR